MSAAGDGSMTQTLIVVILFIGLLATLPWVIRRLQQRQAGALAAGVVGSRVLSAVAVGPQQRVVTVEVGPEGDRAWLVLGVTAQQIQCLHVLKPGAGGVPVPPAPPARSFAVEMAHAAAEAPTAPADARGPHV